MHIVIGIDPGTNHTGWAVVSVTGSGYKLIDAGTISNNIKEIYPNKLLNIGNNLTIITKKYNVTHAIIEESFVNINPRTSLTLASTRGAIILKLAEMNIAIKSISPSEVKKSLTGSGRAEKSQVSRMIKLLLKIDLDERNDTYDAIAIAMSFKAY